MDSIFTVEVGQDAKNGRLKRRTGKEMIMEYRSGQSEIVFFSEMSVPNYTLS
jgi:hypothetical protein